MEKDKEKGTEMTWVINDDPVEKGIAMLQKGRDPLLKSLTVKEPCPLKVEEIEDSARAAYLRIIQMLIGHMAEKGRMKEMKQALLDGKYALEKTEYENLRPDSQCSVKGIPYYEKVSIPDSPDEIYVHKNLSAEQIAKNLKGLVKSLEEVWSKLGEEFPQLEVLCEVKGQKAKRPFDLNTILFGPPGTGKTYRSRTYAVAIAEDRDLDWLENNWSYEEICGKYKALEDAGRVRMVTFHQAYGYEEFIQGIRPVMKKKAEAEDKDTPQELSYEIRTGVFKKFCEEAADHLENRYIFLIDEINRGNIAKIFGELITLIEPSKRKGAEEALSVRLPYDEDDEEPFSVPSNVYLLGTMNTADRSLALLDTALRRRFDFVEMMPDPALLSGVVVEGIDVKTLLENLNTRLELLIDREHTIGHAFFLPLKKDPSIENLARIMKQKVIPLLQEFFYDDYGLLRQVLGKQIVKKRTGTAFKNLKSQLENNIIGRELGDSYFIDYKALELFDAYKDLLGKETDTHE